MKETSFNSHQLVQLLTAAFPKLEDIYLFGSRASDSQHSNSDVDVLLNFKDKNSRLDMINSDLELPGYIDAFVSFGNSAVSLSNKTVIEENNVTSLMRRLHAIKLWDRQSDTIFLSKEFSIADASKVKLTGP